MSEWTQARADLHTDPVVVRQARTLGMDAELVAYKWVRVWVWAREHTADGFVPDVTFDDVDAVIGVPGFCGAAPRWAVSENGGVRFPKWEKHNSNGARERFLNNERQRVSRKRHGNVTVERDKSATTPLPEQSRAEQIRAEQSGAKDQIHCSALEPHSEIPLRSALLGCGLTPEQVETMLAHENADERKLRYAVARWNEDRAKARPPPRHPARWIERVAEIRTTSVPEKLAARKSEVSRQFAAVRSMKA